MKMGARIYSVSQSSASSQVHSMQSPPQLARYRLRGWLLLAACPLVAAIAYLVFAIKAPPSTSRSISLNSGHLGGSLAAGIGV